MDVLESISQIWNSAEANSGEYVINRSLSPSVVYGELLANFSPEQINQAIYGFLEEMSNVMAEDGAPGRRNIFLCSCCLKLISLDGGARMPVPLVQKVLRTFPISIWYRTLIPVVTAYLSVSDLLEAMLSGLSGKPSRYAIENCLQGIAMYRNFARNADDGRLNEIIAALRPLINGYVDSALPDIPQFARRAQKALELYSSPTSKGTAGK